jgi:4-aminobutyrate--pyruvate transaminase
MRTGNMWGAQTYCMEPDMLTCAKALSAAYLPIAAVMVSEKIYSALVSESEKIGVFAHGFTYSGHPVASAVALETLKIYEERDLLSHVRKVAPRMQDGLRRFENHPIVGEVRGVGLMGGIELVADKAAKTPFDPKINAAGFLGRRCQHHGLILRPIGETIAFCPPLIIEEHEIDLMLERFGLALDDTLAMVRERGLV